MKKLLLSLSIFIIAYSSWSREPLIIIDSTISYYFSSSLDSMLQGKTIYTHDENGNRLVKASYAWDASHNEWIGSSCNENSFDANNNIIKNVAYKWDNLVGSWITTSKNESNYDTDGNLTENIRFKRDPGDEDWIPVEKIEYTHTNDGLRLWETRSSWDPESMTLTLQTKHKYTYSDTGNPLLFSEYNWDKIANEWVATRMIDYIYNDHGKLEEQIIVTRTDTHSEWLNSARSVIEYDAGDNPISYNQYHWDLANSDWGFDNRFEIFYDADGNRTEMTSFLWDPITGSFIGTNRYINSYDDFGNNTFGEIYVWDPYEADWSIRVKYEYLFDDCGNILAQMLYLQNQETNSPEIMKKDFYYYSQLEITAVMETGPDHHICIYPNPASDIVYISSPFELVTEIHDLSGRKVICTRSLYIDVSTLKSGIYIVRMSDTNYKLVKSEKLIVR